MLKSPPLLVASFSRSELPFCTTEDTDGIARCMAIEP